MNHYTRSLLTKAASGVLARHCRLTVSAAFTNVTRLTQRVVNLSGSTYRSEYASPLRWLRPCWTAFLNRLRMMLGVSVRG